MDNNYNIRTYENEPEVQEWIDQGRDPEHVYAVKNFLTGKGVQMIERLKRGTDSLRS